MHAATRASPRRPLIPARWAPYVFISPFFVLFGAFGLFPLLFSIVLSFHQWDPVSGVLGMHAVGWDNCSSGIHGNAIGPYRRGHTACRTPCCGFRRSGR